MPALSDLRRVPNVQEVIITARSELRTIRGPLQADNFLRVGVLPPGKEGILGANIAVDNGMVAGPRGQNVLVPSQSPNTISMIIEAPQFLALVDVPKLNTRVTIRGTDGDVGGGKGNPGNGGDGVTFSDLHQLVDLTGGGVPEVDTLVEGDGEDVVLRPVQEIKVVIILHLRGIENALGERGDVAEVVAVLLVGDFVVGVKDGAGDGGRGFFGDRGFGFEGEDLGIIKLPIIKGVSQKGLVVIVGGILAVFIHHRVVRQVEVGQIIVHGRPVGDKTIAFRRRG